MPLNAEQREAVEYLDDPLLVLAGPGTGKTQLLSAKVAYILENTDAGPENILCLTFTEAGAENMRDRLRTMIGKSAENVNIYTYHAFGKNLLDRYRNYAEQIDRELETAIDQTAQYRIVAEIQQKLPAIDILRTAQTKDIIETISNAKSARLSSLDLRKIAERNLEDSDSLSAEISPILEAMRRGARLAEALEKTWRPVLEILLARSSPHPITGNIEPLANSLARELNSAIKEAESSNSVKPISAWKTKNFEKDSAGQFRLKDHIANKKLLSLAGIMESYDQKLAANHLFDFDDMIETTINYLKTDDGFRLSLCELFQYVLLDEFQDTNPSQFELIKLLTDYEKPVVMAVGDDDQAIYAFQGANASNLMEFAEHYHAKQITLINNYRSTSEILKFSRHIADQIEDSFAKSYTNVDKNLHAIKTPDVSNSLISRHEFPCAEAEYDWVAEQIRDLVDQGENPSEIAILAPKHKQLVAILPYLKRQNLEIAYEKRENLLQDEIIQQLIEMARFIHALASEKSAAHQLLPILSYDFWQIPPSKVIGLFTDRRDRRPALELLENSEDFVEIAHFFASLVAKSYTAPLELWLDYLIGTEKLGEFRSPFLAYYQEHLSEAELLEFYENLATFREVVNNYAATLHSDSSDYLPKLADFVTTVNDYKEAGSEIMRISNFNSNRQAVQVMTAYKSKGLEFKHVFLTAVDNLAWGKAKGNNNLLVLPKNLVQIRHTGASDDEKLRVLFVALTRAKSSLTLTSSRFDSSGKANARLVYLNEGSFEDPDAISAFLPRVSQRIKIHQEFDDAKKISLLKMGWISRYQKILPEAEPILRSRVEKYRLNASDLTSFIDLVYAGPQAIYRRLILREPEPPTTFQQSYGTLLHKVFEKVTKDHLDIPAALDFFRSLVPQTTLEAEDQRLLLETGLHSLETSLHEFSPILNHEHARAELNLASEHLNLEGVPLTGKIDHLNIDPTHKIIEVYDFKTGKHTEKSRGDTPALYKYRLQLSFYKLLLNLSPTFRQYSVPCGHILFVTPDQDRKVYEEIYTYNPHDEEELRRLIKSVYYQITSLDFIKDAELFLPADSTKKLSDIKHFVEKLIEMTENS